MNTIVSASANIFTSSKLPSFVRTLHTRSEQEDRVVGKFKNELTILVVLALSGHMKCSDSKLIMEVPNLRFQ